MSIEILTVSLSDESMEALAELIYARLQNGGMVMNAGRVVTQSEPPSPNFPQSAEPSGFQAQPDPWQNGAGAPPVQQPQLSPTAQVMTGYQAPPQQYQGPPPAVQQGPPDRYCTHGKMRYVPAGVYQSGPRTGQPRAAFYGCSLQRGDPNQCKPVNV